MHETALVLGVTYRSVKRWVAQTERGLKKLRSYPRGRYREIKPTELVKFAERWGHDVNWAALGAERLEQLGVQL